MCGYVLKSTRFQIAKKPIVVYKNITRGNRAGVFSAFLYKPRTKHSLGKKLKKYRPFRNGGYEIHEGFHAYLSECSARFGKRWSGLKTVRMVIPAGTRFIKESGRNIVIAEAIRTGDLKPLKRKQA